MITLSAEEKRAMCSALAAELPKIRELLGAKMEEADNTEDDTGGDVNA